MVMAMAHISNARSEEHNTMMTEDEVSDGMAREAGDESTASRMSLDSTSTFDDRVSRPDIGRYSRRPSERDRGTPSQLPYKAEPLLRRGRSTGSSRIRPLPTPVTIGDQGVDSDALTFDADDLLQEGLSEWQDRAISLQNLRRASSMRNQAREYRGLEETPSFRFFERQQSARRSHESYGETEGSTQGAIQYSTGDERDGGNFQFSEASEDGTYGGTGRLGLATPGFETPGNILLGSGMPYESQITEEEGRTLDLNREFYATLAEAPQASLIHLVSLYHQALLRHGLLEEAERITNVLAGFPTRAESVSGEELKGMDLLLQEGLLKYLTSVQPHLPPLPSQIVKFKGLTYSTKVKMEKGYETMFTKVKGLLTGLLQRAHVEDVKVLKDVTGYLMPGTLTLIVGPPGAGKSALLHVLGGRPISPGDSLAGTVTYNGKNVHDVRHERLAALVSSVDIHLPPLTVRETLEFARDCSQAYRAKHYSEELRAIMGEALKEKQDPKLELNLSMMGLKRVADRPVGSPAMPTLTAGERHRLTIAEMVAGTYAVYIVDQLSGGVDFDLVTSVRIFARVRQAAVLAHILQPPSEVFALFDRVILLDGGQVMFQGPRQDVLPYFEALGYVKPNHLSTSEFLQEVTTPEGVRYLQPGYPRLERDDFVASFLLSPTFRDICRVVDNVDLVQELWLQGNKPLGLGFTESRSNNGIGLGNPMSTLVAGVIEKGGSLAEVSMNHTSTVSPGDEVVAVGGAGEMLKYFKADDGQGNDIVGGRLAEAIDEVAEPVRLQLERPHNEANVTKAYSMQFERDYVLDPIPEARVLLRRELKVIFRNKFALQIRVAQVLIMSAYTGVVFFRVQHKPNQLDMNLLRGVFFISVLNMTMFNLGQLPALMEERAIYYKQQLAHFYRPQSFLFAKVLGGLPMTIFEATLWTLITYFLTGLSVDDGGWHFWVYLIIMNLTAINGASLVRFMAYFAPDRDVANALTGVLIAIFILFAGFLVPRFSVPHYWIWAYYIDPLQWAITALVINEYNSKDYSLLCSQVPNIANIPQCVGRSTNTVGHAFLARGQFYTSNNWIAVAVAVLVGWIVLLNLGANYALTRLRHLTQRLSPSLEMKLTSKEQHVVKVNDEEWGHPEVNLCFTSIPVTLSWHELSYDIMIPAIGKTHTMLNYVSGWGKTGEMVAFLGGAGAGKTTLLNCLAGRNVALARIGGQILVNGYPKVHKTFAHVEGYVDDLGSHPPFMTVREAVELSAAMRLGKKASSKRRKDYVEEVIQLVRISHISNMLLFSIGNEEISRDSAVRLSIAIELAGNPSVMFLDEPIKGLDSHASGHIIDCLKRIADTGRLVIATLTQPSPRQLMAFTSVQLLKRGGETVYFGPVGTNAELLRKYFEAIPGTPLCPPCKSPVSHAIDVIGDGVADSKGQRDYAFEYRVSEMALRNHIQLQNLRRSKGQNGPELLESGYRAPYSLMAWEIILKMQRFYWRNVNYNFGRMTSALLTGLILGSVYFNINPHTTVNMNVKSQSLFITCILLGISNAQNIIPQVLRMSASLEREQASHQYSVFLHNIAWTFAEVPYLAVATLLVCFVFCLMAQIAVHSAAQFFRFYFVLFEFCLAITFLGIFIVVISPKPQIAASIVPIIIGFWTSTGGSVVPKRKLLKTVIWVFWSNPLQYALNALTSIAFFCDTNKPSCLDSGTNMACLNDPTACPRCDCDRLKDAKNAFVWTTLEYNRSLDNDRIPYDILALALFALLFRLGTFAALSYKKRKRQSQ